MAIEDLELMLKELRATDRELTFHSQMHEAIVNSVPVIISFSTEEEGIKWFNKYWYDLTGMTEAESLGFGYRTAMREDVIEEVTQYSNACMAKGDPFSGTISFRCKEGYWHKFMYWSRPIRDNGHRGWLDVFSPTIEVQDEVGNKLTNGQHGAICLPNNVQLRHHIFGGDPHAMSDLGEIDKLFE